MDDITAELAAEALMVRIGEAANQLGRKFAIDYPAIELRAIVETRNVAAHGYDSVDHKLLWSAYENRLPEVIQEIRRILTPLGIEITDIEIPPRFRSRSTR